MLLCSSGTFSSRPARRCTELVCINLYLLLSSQRQRALAKREREREHERERNARVCFLHRLEDGLDRVLVIRADILLHLFLLVTHTHSQLGAQAEEWKSRTMKTARGIPRGFVSFASVVAGMLLTPLAALDVDMAVGGDDSLT